MKIFDFDAPDIIAKVNQSGPLHGMGIDSEFLSLAISEIARADNVARTGERYGYPGTRQASFTGMAPAARSRLRTALLDWTRFDPDGFALAGIDLVQFLPGHSLHEPIFHDGLMGEFDLFVTLDCAKDSEWLVIQNQKPHPHLRPQPSLSSPRLNVMRGSASNELHCRALCAMQPGKWILLRAHDCAHGVRSKAPCWMLRIRFNRRSIDPEGVDPVLNYFVENSPLIAEQLADEQLTKLRVVLSPRVDHLRTTFSRQNWRTFRHVKISDGRTMSISQEEFDLLYQLDRSKLAERLIWPPRQQRFSEAGFIRSALQEGLLIIAPEAKNMALIQASDPLLRKAG